MRLYHTDVTTRGVEPQLHRTLDFAAINAGEGAHMTTIYIIAAIVVVLMALGHIQFRA